MNVVNKLKNNFFKLSSTSVDSSRKKINNFVSIISDLAMSSHLMLAARRGSLLISCLRPNVRAFSTPVEAPKPAESAANGGSSMRKGTHVSENSKIESLASDGINDINDYKLQKVDNLERRMLVWTKKYKTIEDVPDYVT